MLRWKDNGRNGVGYVEASESCKSRVDRIQRVSCIIKNQVVSFQHGYSMLD